MSDQNKASGISDIQESRKLWIEPEIEVIEADEAEVSIGGTGADSGIYS